MDLHAAAVFEVFALRIQLQLAEHGSVLHVVAVEHNVVVRLPVHIARVREHRTAVAGLPVEIVIEIVFVVPQDDGRADVLAGDQPADQIRIDFIELCKAIGDPVLALLRQRRSAEEVKPGTPADGTCGLKHLLQLVLGPHLAMLLQLHVGKAAQQRQGHDDQCNAQNSQDSSSTSLAHAAPPT